MKKNLLFISLVSVFFIFNACKKSTDSYAPTALDKYNPLVVGKYITYKLDSLIYINFGSKDTTVTYQAKYEVSARITDNLNRPAFRITRYKRKTAANPWVSDATFMWVNTGNTLEFVENNLRFLKMILPVQDGKTWKGNTYIDTYSLNSDLKYLDDWDYAYDSVNARITVGAYTLDSTVKVNQRNEVVGNPSDPNSYSEVNYGMEKYALGIGMVYRKFFHNEYQPPTPGRGGYYQGYGITLTMIDHN